MLWKRKRRKFKNNGFYIDSKKNKKTKNLRCATLCRYKKRNIKKKWSKRGAKIKFEFHCNQKVAAATAAAAKH